MCGIFGIVSKEVKHPAELRAFAIALAQESAARGTDATGFAGFSDGEFSTDKLDSASTSFVRRSKAWRKAMMGTKLAIIGHTRAATSGSPKKLDNNHPFHSEKYSLVHNGGIWLHEQIAFQYGFNLVTECDSELILHFVASQAKLTNGILDALRVLDEVGTMAVAVVDKTDQSVNLFRTKDSPCVLMSIPRWNAVVFSSTLEIFCKAALPFFGSMKALYENAQPVLNHTDIPDYTHVRISPDGEVTCESLHSALTEHFGHGYRGRSLNWMMDDQMAIFSGLAQSKYSNVKKKDVSAPSNTEETAIFCNGCLTPIKNRKCAHCGADNSIDDKPQIPELEFKPPVPVIDLCDLIGKEKKTDGAALAATAPSNPTPIQSHAQYDRLMALRKASDALPSVAKLLSIVPEQFTAGDPSQIASLLNECREPVEADDLRIAEIGVYFSYSSSPIQVKLDKWDQTSLLSIGKMSDGEYLAYYEFVTSVLEARIEAV